MLSWILVVIACAAAVLAERGRRRALRAQREARAAELRVRDDLDNILHHLGSGLISLDRAGVVRRMNPAAGRILLLDEEQVVGACMTDAFEPGLADFTRILAQVLAGGEPAERREVTIQGPDGERVPVGLSVHPVHDDGGIPVGAVAIFQDLSEILAMREQLRDQDRLAAIGELSAGIAHDIRNPLGSIRGSAEFLLAELDVTDREKALLELILKESRRVNLLIADFLAFARMRPPQVALVEVERLLESIALQLRTDPRAGGGLEIATRTEPGDLLALLDEDQLSQVLLNLGLNACDAMKGSGRIEIEASLDEGNTTCILTVKDDGPGIDPAVRDTLFEPFVTTKGGGTGLGLPMVKRIIGSHGGSVRVLDSERGCTFRVEIPLVRSRHEAAPADAVAAVAPPPEPVHSA